jgi:hypothetical protein
MRLLALAALVACSKEPTFERRELPGFSVELPAGQIKEESLDYANGRVEILRPAGVQAVVGVNWEVGGTLSRDDLVLFAKGSYGALGLTPGPFIQVPGPDGKPVETATGTMTGGKRVLTSMITCGGRHIAVVTGGLGEIDPIHGKVVASLACHPDAAREAELDRPPLVIDLPTGWKPVRDLPGMTAYTNDDEAILLRAITGTRDDAGIPKVLTSLFQAMGAPVTVHDRAGDVYPLDGTLEGSKVVGFAMIHLCPPNQVIIVALAETQVRANDLAKLVREHSHCTRK